MNFNDFQFAAPITKAVKQCGYSSPTQIQQQTIPHLLLGKDLLGLAQTGTGKTAAYLLPTVQSITTQSEKGIKALILVPTRELAEQVYENTRQLTAFTGLKTCTVYGGVSKAGQISSLQRGTDIVIACPGRLLDHINSKTIDLSTLSILILDEADQMCDKGFLPDIRRILRHVPQKRQSMVFSATMPDEIRGFVEDILHNPVTVQIGHNRPTASISHTLFQVSQEKKSALLKELLDTREIDTAIVFTRTKYKAKKLAGQLFRRGISATSLQGNLSQNRRKEAMDGFRSGKYSILVATDIAARGLDVSGISHVINYDVPDTVEAFTHRVGRTGRANETGRALTFATSGDTRIIRMIEHDLGKIFSHTAADALLVPAKSVQEQPQENRKQHHTLPQKTAAATPQKKQPRPEKKEREARRTGSRSSTSALSQTSSRNRRRHIQKSHTAV